jgi:hypothetical protein
MYVYITVTARVNLGKTSKFLIGTGAEISNLRSTTMRPEFNYEPTKGIDVKGISDVLWRTKGTVTEIVYLNARNTHLFHIMGDNFDCRYDGILNQDF